MSALVDAVRARTPPSCQATGCQKEGVSASLGGLPRERVFVDLDCKELNTNPAMRRCDFILAYGEAEVAAIELKSGDVELAQVARQLEGGGRIADQRLLPSNPPGLRFRPVVVYGGKFNRRKGKKPTATVKFRGKRYVIKAIRDGSPLSKALSGA